MNTVRDEVRPRAVRTIVVHERQKGSGSRRMKGAPMARRAADEVGESRESPARKNPGGANCPGSRRKGLGAGQTIRACPLTVPAQRAD